MAKRDREKQEEFSFEDILDELQSSSNEIECGPYTIKELTMHHQRKNLTAGMEPVEAPLRLNKLFNEYIIENVTSTSDYGEIGDIVDVSERPYLINLLRKATLGSEYKEGEVVYMMYDVTDDDFNNIGEKSTSFECGSLVINLEYPSLNKDNRINDLLSDALKPFKNRRLTDDDYGKITDIYSLYEIIKYIFSIEKNGETIEFDTISIANRKKFIDRLPLRYIDIIGDFMKTVKDHEVKCFTAHNPEKETETVEMDINTLFSAKNSQ